MRLPAGLTRGQVWRWLGQAAYRKSSIPMSWKAMYRYGSTLRQYWTASREPWRLTAPTCPCGLNMAPSRTRCTHLLLASWNSGETSFPQKLLSRWDTCKLIANPNVWFIYLFCFLFVNLKWMIPSSCCVYACIRWRKGKTPCWRRRSCVSKVLLAARVIVMKKNGSYTTCSGRLQRNAKNLQWSICSSTKRFGNPFSFRSRIADFYRTAKTHKVLLVCGWVLFFSTYLSRALLGVFS